MLLERQTVLETCLDSHLLIVATIVGSVLIGAHGHRRARALRFEGIAHDIGGRGTTIVWPAM